MNPPPPRIQPAFLAGLFIAILSSLPIVGWLNVCCCLWVLAGGALAVWLSQTNHSFALSAADGALIGLLAGFFGGIIAIPIAFITEHWNRDLLLRVLSSAQAEIPPQFESLLEAQRSVLLTLANGLFMTVVYAIFAMLGGLLGVAVFKKKDLPPPGTIDVLPPV